jgi:hypothetical protein
VAVTGGVPEVHLFPIGEFSAGAGASAKERSPEPVASVQGNKRELASSEQGNAAGELFVLILVLHPVKVVGFLNQGAGQSRLLPENVLSWGVTGGVGQGVAGSTECGAGLLHVSVASHLLGNDHLRSGDLPYASTAFTHAVLPRAVNRDSVERSSQSGDILLKLAHEFPS